MVVGSCFPVSNFILSPLFVRACVCVCAHCVWIHICGYVALASLWLRRPYVAVRNHPPLVLPQWGRVSQSNPDLADTAGFVKQSVVGALSLTPEGRTAGPPLRSPTVSGGFWGSQVLFSLLWGKFKPWATFWALIFFFYLTKCQLLTTVFLLIEGVSSRTPDAGLTIDPCTQRTKGGYVYLCAVICTEAFT